MQQPHARDFVNSARDGHVIQAKMKLIILKCMVTAIFLLYSPTYILGQGNEKQIVGIYKSRVKDKSFIILQLHDDKSARIESTFWIGKSAKDRKTNKFDANWEVKGLEVFVTYNGIEQILSYYGKLNLKEYGIKQSIPGLITSTRNKNHGLLDSIKLWRQDELREILSGGKTVIQPETETGRSQFFTLTTFIILVFLISAIIGCKKPLIGGVIGTVVLPLLYFLFNDSGAVVLVVLCILGFFLGLIAGFIGFIFVSGWRGKGHNIGPSYMSGFGGGRSARPGGIVLSDEERKHIKK